MDESGFSLSDERQTRYSRQSSHQQQDGGNDDPPQMRASRRRLLERASRREHEEQKLHSILGRLRQIGLWGGLALLAIVASSKVVVPATFELHPAARDLNGQTMRAVLMMHQHGVGNVHYDAYYPAPERGPQSYLIQVKASALPPIGYMALLQKLGAYPFTHFPASFAAFFVPLPKVLGLELAGIVLQAFDGSKFEVGDRVAAHLPVLGTPWGAHAEYVVIEEAFMARIGPHTSFATAAATPAVALTAIPPLKKLSSKLNKKPKAKVLVQVQDAVGAFALQYAKHAMNIHEVAAATSSVAAHIHFLQRLGADWVLAGEDVQRMHCGDPEDCYDVVFELHEHRDLLPVVKSTGHYLNDLPLYSSPSLGHAIATVGIFLKFKVINLVWSGIVPNYHVVLGVLVHPDGQLLQEALDLVDSGKLRPIIDRKFHLSQAAEAYRFWGEHATTTIGKVILYHDSREEVEAGDNNVEEQERKEAESREQQEHVRRAEEAREQEEQRRLEEETRAQEEQQRRAEEETRAQEEHLRLEGEATRAQEEQRRWEEEQRQGETLSETAQEKQQDEQESWEDFLVEEQRHQEEAAE